MNASSSSSAARRIASSLPAAVPPQVLLPQPPNGSQCSVAGSTAIAVRGGSTGVPQGSSKKSGGCNVPHSATSRSRCVGDGDKLRLLYVAVALSEIDHVTFHRLKFQQLCKVTRADAPCPFPPQQAAPDGDNVAACPASLGGEGEAVASLMSTLSSPPLTSGSPDVQPSPTTDTRCNSNGEKEADNEAHHCRSSTQHQHCNDAAAAAKHDDPSLANNKTNTTKIPSRHNNTEDDYVDFRMLAFTKEGTFMTQWINDEDRARYSAMSPTVIPSVESVPFVEPTFVDPITEEAEEDAAEPPKSVADGDGCEEGGSNGNAAEGTGGASDEKNTAKASDSMSQASPLYVGGREENTSDAGEATTTTGATTARATTSSPSSSSSASSSQQQQHIRPDNAIIEGRRDEAKKRTLCLVRVSHVCAFDMERMRHFLQQNQSADEEVEVVVEGDSDNNSSPLGSSKEDPSAKMVTARQKKTNLKNHLVFGAHGYGFALGVNVRVVRGEDDVAYVDRCSEDDGYYVSMSLVDLVRVLEGMRFRSVCFDCCLMSTAQTAASMYKCTSHVVACEGYMWEEDDDIEKHVLNSYSARYLCFGVDGTEETFAGHNGEGAEQQRRFLGVAEEGSEGEEEVAADHQHNDDVSPVKFMSSPNVRCVTAAPSPLATCCHDPTIVLTATATSSRSPTQTLVENNFQGAAAAGGPFQQPLPPASTPLTRALAAIDRTNESKVMTLTAVARHFASNSPRGDIAVLNTEAGTLLYHHLLLSKAKIVPFLHRPASLTTRRPLGLDIVGPLVRQCAPLDSRDPEVGSFLYDVAEIVNTIGDHVVGCGGGGGGNNGSSPFVSVQNTPAHSQSINSVVVVAGAAAASSRAPSPAPPPPFFFSNGGGGGGYATNSTNMHYTSITPQWVAKARELLAAAVVFAIGPREEEHKYYTCKTLRGMSVKI